MMKRLIASAALALALAGCAGVQPPEDGMARVYQDGRWVLVGHNHGDPVLHLDRCRGCAEEFARAWRGELQRADADARAARAQASAAPISSEGKAR